MIDEQDPHNDVRNQRFVGNKPGLTNSVYLSWLIAGCQATPVDPLPIFNRSVSFSRYILPDRYKPYRMYKVGYRSEKRSSLSMLRLLPPPLRHSCRHSVAN
jgi:hypothetical protein